MRSLPPLVACALITPAFAETIEVPEDQPSIQAAVDAAASGDLISIAPGVYRENLVLVDKTLTLLGRKGAAVTILDGGGAGSVLRMTGDSEDPDALTLTGLTLQAGAALQGGGIYASAFQGAPHSLVMDSCIVRGNLRGTIPNPITAFAAPTEQNFTMEHCDFEGGDDFPGPGNFSANPKFVAPAAGDYHLKPGSPCIGAGDAPLGIVAVDFEGNARDAAPDLGADENAPHLYHVGTPAPGGDLSLRIAGHVPGTLVTIWLDSAVNDPPLPTGFGDFWLASRRVLVASRLVPGDGTLEVDDALPATVPAGTLLYAQALAAGRFSNLEVARVD